MARMEMDYILKNLTFQVVSTRLQKFDFNGRLTLEVQR